MFGLFLFDNQHRKPRQKQGGGLKHSHIFSLCLLVFPYSVLHKSTGGRKKKEGLKGGGVFDGAGRETDRKQTDIQPVEL